MHPYRSPIEVPLAPSPAALATLARSTTVDPIGPLLFAVGGLLVFAGMLFADGTEFAVGGLMVMAAWRRVTAQASDDSVRAEW